KGMRDGHEVEAALAGCVERPLVGPSDPEGRVRLLDGLRVHRGFWQVPELAVELEGLLGPRGRDDLDGLLEALAALVAWHSIHLEVGGRVSETDAELEAPAGDDVDHRVVLGDLHRVVQREDRNGGAEVDARRAV